MRYRCIPPLMRSRQAERATPFVLRWKHPNVGPASIALGVRPGAGPNCLTPQHLNQSRIGLADDERHARLGDSCLLAGNELETVAQILHVVASDLGYSAYQRAHHVGAIESSAEPHLHYRDLDSTGCKVGKGESRRSLEEGRLPFQNGRQETAGPHGHGFLRDGNTIHLNSLPERDEMRRGIQAHPPACFAQRGGNQSAHTALSVGAANVH